MSINFTGCNPKTERIHEGRRKEGFVAVDQREASALVSSAHLVVEVREVFLFLKSKFF